MLFQSKWNPFTTAEELKLKQALSNIAKILNSKGIQIPIQYKQVIEKD